MAKRTRRDKRRRREAIPARPMIPSAPTLFRQHLLAPKSQDMLAETLGKLKPKILERDQPRIDQIERAETVEEVLDLAINVKGLADRAWHRRIQAFGPEVAPLICERLKNVQDMHGRDAQSTVYENLLSALVFYGEAGIEATLDCFDALDDYGKSLACVVLGRLGSQDSADRLWGFYQAVMQESDERCFVGPLWGLVDLEDSRAADALGELLWEERFFYESFAMAYKAGDARCVLPLMFAFVEGSEAARDLAIWALVGVAQRIGRENLLAEMRNMSVNADFPPAEQEKIADKILMLPQRGADEYFAVFYEGIDPDAIDMEAIGAKLSGMDRVGLSMDEGDWLDREAPPPGQRPGRNDPCWCGSGNKYKHCHWRENRERGR